MVKTIHGKFETRILITIHKKHGSDNAWLICKTINNDLPVRWLR